MSPVQCDHPHLSQPQLLCALTLVWPNWYWVWSMSREPSSFSVAFLLSMKVSSGMALGFRMRYLGQQEKLVRRG